MKVVHHKGYEFIVTSWENDADNYKTKFLDGLSKESVKLLLRFTDLFKPSWQGGIIGNIPNFIESRVVAARQVLVDFYKDNKEEFIKFFGEEPKKDEYISDWMIELASDLELSGADWYTRVCAEVKVRYWPEDVSAEEMSLEEFK